MDVRSAARRAGQVIWEGLVHWGLWAGGHPQAPYWYHERELWLRHTAATAAPADPPPTGAGRHTPAAVSPHTPDSPVPAVTV